MPTSTRARRVSEVPVARDGRPPVADRLRFGRVWRRAGTSLTLRASVECGVGLLGESPLAGRVSAEYLLNGWASFDRQRTPCTGMNQSLHRRAVVARPAGPTVLRAVDAPA